MTRVVEPLERRSSAGCGLWHIAIAVTTALAPKAPQPLAPVLRSTASAM
jgi:hypothetical protein